ncbi:hypothetical protein [Umezawaea sp. Da 62-37]|uniref:hypothetical protein n=1 Tax=Umezawaea sp. Da 62-37 TaxID=3075927 RepID=UPI0028F6C9F6|nr:hypothetical protein [Umezawaea sp. Da 62-37]WNV83135.1 hypothetical protein RM788_33780 [Umezawaea sp. Da 62-37]
MSAAEPVTYDYDPDEVHAAAFSNPALAADLAFALTCHEVSSLVAALRSRGGSDAAARWLTHHLVDCDDPPRHQQ